MELVGYSHLSHTLGSAVFDLGLQLLPIIVAFYFQVLTLCTEASADESQITIFVLATLEEGYMFFPHCQLSIAPLALFDVNKVWINAGLCYSYSVIH